MKLLSLCNMLIRDKENIDKRIIFTRKNDNFPTSFHNTTLIVVSRAMKKETRAIIE